MRFLFVLVFALAATAPSLGAQDLDAPRPIAGTETVFIEEMTWMEVRDALLDGMTTAIVATGGVEQNGPYVASGKHNFVLSATTRAIAEELGDALVAPIVKFVPEGSIDPPSGHMRYHATVSVRQETFEALLTDIVMPGMSGPELAEAVRATHPETRVLFMSAFSDEALIEQGRLQSGMPVLEKPFEEDDLARKVRDLLS